MKEVWEVPESVFKKGYIQHTLGWPLQSKIVAQDTFGGSFVYHMEPNVSDFIASNCLWSICRLVLLSPTLMMCFTLYHTLS